MKPYYQEGGQTIYLGDCREVLPELREVPVGLVVTDPPYNLGKKYGAKSSDSLDPDVYWPWFEEVFKSVFAVMDDGYAYISHSDKGIYQAKPLLETLNFEYLQTLVWWGKNGYSMQLHRKTWSYRHELILFMQKGDPPALNTGEKGAWYTSVIEAPRPQSNFTEGRCHPTQKPLKLYKTLIYRTPGDVILDPFMGSGTSLVSAKVLGRKAIGIEIEEKYCEIAAKRLSQSVMDLTT